MLIAPLLGYLYFYVLSMTFGGEELKSQQTLEQIDLNPHNKVYHHVILARGLLILPTIEQRAAFWLLSFL